MDADEEAARDGAGRAPAGTLPLAMLLSAVVSGTHQGRCRFIALSAILLAACSGESTPNVPTVRDANEARAAAREAAGNKPADQATPTLNRAAKVPSDPKLLVPSSELERLRAALLTLDAQSDAKEARDVCFEVTGAIARTISIEYSRLRKAGKQPYLVMHPARASWDLTASAHAGIDIDGLEGLFGNEGENIRLMPEAFELFAMPDWADAFRDAMAIWPSDKPFHTWPVPLTDEQKKAFAACEERMHEAVRRSPKQDPFEVRPRYAVEHPEIFFVTSRP